MNKELIEGMINDLLEWQPVQMLTMIEKQILLKKLRKKLEGVKCT